MLMTSLSNKTVRMDGTAKVKKVAESIKKDFKKILVEN